MILNESITLTYDIDGQSYDYDLDNDDVLRYVKSNYIWDDLVKIFQDDIDESGLTDKDSDDEWSSLMDEIIENNSELFYDELYDYYKDQAEADLREVIQDEEDYLRDPYLYNGVSRRDFY